jgi:hypothetical protein
LLSMVVSGGDCSESNTVLKTSTTILRYTVGMCTHDASRFVCRPADVEFGLVVGLWHKGTSSHSTTATTNFMRSVLGCHARKMGVSRKQNKMC